MIVAATKGQVPGADITVEPVVWVLFLALVVGLILADLLLFHREAHEISTREAAISSAVWVAMGLSFTFVVWGFLGGSAAGQYLTGYLIEKSLSVDNVFVWAVILSYFAVPATYQHRVLFWGIFGALALRFAFIFAGVALLETFDWVIYVFGGFLLFTAYRVATHSGEEVHPEQNPILRLMRRWVPITSEYHGQRFFIRRDARRFATPLLVVLVMIEATDVVFALDSIPAILAITHSQFLVFSSNAFAILGLRALYFLLVGVTGRLVYLNEGLGVILAFVGLKMLLVEVIHIPTWASLGFVALVLAITVVLSLRVEVPEPTTTSDGGDPGGNEGGEPGGDHGGDPDRDDPSRHEDEPSA